MAPHMESDDDDLDLDDVDDELDDMEDDEDLSDEDEEFLTPERTVDILERAIAEGAGFVRSGGLIAVPDAMRCRKCGCDDQRACPGGCFWVAPHLCSRCMA